MTKKEMFQYIITNTADEQIIEFCNHEIALLEKKSATPSKPTANQLENVKYREAILSILAEADAPMTISAMCEDDRLSGLKNQRVSALVTQLKKENKVVRSEVKRVAYFALAE